MRYALKIALITAFVILAVIVATLLFCVAESYEPPISYSVSEPLMVCETELL